MTLRLCGLFTAQPEPQGVGRGAFAKEGDKSEQHGAEIE